ncbi:BapA/Bap/LapF family large adhesin, partial [Alteromonas gracilis]
VTLTITDSAGVTQTVTAIVQADGTYSVDAPAELAEGEFTVNASVNDEAGNTATTDTTGVIDTTAPSITIDTIATGNDTTPTLSGTTDAAPGSTVTLTITDSAGVTQTVTAIVQADGTYSVDVPAELAEGEFTVSASVTDEAGNTATADTTGEIDTTAPTITINAPSSDNDTTPTLSGTTDATPGSTVTLTITDSAGNTQTVTAIVQADGTYSVDVPAELAEGEFTVNASVTDEAGNSATADTIGEIDTTAPSITIDAIATDNDTTPTLSGTTDATPGSTVTLTITDSAGNTQTVTAIVQADGTYSVDVAAELAEGEFTVNASVTDTAGNTANADAQGAIDVTAPIISLNDPGINGDATPTLSGLTDAVPGSTITLIVTDSAGVTQTFTTNVLADGTFTVEVSNAVAEGTYSVTAEVTDGAGNTAQATASGDYDSTSPSTTVNQPAPTNDTTPNVSGETDAPPGSEVVIVVTDSQGNEQTIVTIVGADGTFNEDVPAELSEGEYTVDVTVTTPAGNSSTTTVTGEIDTTAPIISLDPIGSTNDDTPVINGDTDAEPGAIVTLEIVHSDGTTQTLTATVQEDGSFSAEVPQTLANGDFTVSATVSDVAGNTASTSIDAVINTQGPNVVIETGSPTNGSEGIGGSSDAPNSEVVVVITDSDGNSQTITGTTDENGNFNVAFPPGSEEGEYEIEVTVTDENGNSSTATATTVLDTTPPIVNINPQTDTNDTTPTISGNTDLPAGSEVVITVTDSQGNTQTVTAVVDENGNFSADVEEALAEGNYEFSVEATDAAGNTTTAVDNSGNIDTTAPALSLDPQTDGSDTTPTISGSTDLPLGSTVTIVVTDSAGNTQTIDAIVDENGDFSVDVQTPLTEGEYTVEASATDEAGNTTTVTENGGNIDTQAPTISLEPLGTGNDTTPSISGSTNLEAGSTVTLTVTDSAGTSQTFTATVDANGEFSADVPAELADGDYNVEATATDAAGNSASTSQTGTVDSNAPSLTLDPLGDDNDTTPTISGTTDLPAGSTVTLSVTDALGNTQTFTATVDGSGNFSVDVPNPLAEGEYSVTATATDGDGNTTTVTDNGGVVDTTSPTLTLENPGSTGDTTPTLSGTTDLPEGSTVTLVVTDSAGNTQTISALVDVNGNFSVDVPNALADGDFTVTASATDSAGNTANTNTKGNVDSEAPLLTLDTQGATSDVTPTITGTSDVAPGTLVTITVVDANGNSQSFQAAVQADGTFSADVPSALAEGDFTVTATVSDAQGNTATANETNGSIDTQAPIVTVNPLDSGNDTTPVISGNTDLPEGAVVVITVTDSNGDTQTINALVDADGNFATEVLSPLPEGDYSVEVTATDDAGNSTTATEDGGNIDTTAPVLTLNPQGTGNDETPNISGSTDLAPGSTVTLTVTDSAGNTQTFDAIVDANGDFSADVPNAIPDGSYTVTASASDDAGNTTTTSDTGTLDTSAPALTLDAQVTVSDTTPTISGTTDLPAGSTVTLSVTDSAGNTQTFTALVDASGNFSADVPAPLAEGDYSVTATATDSNGNSASVTDNNGIVDTVPPVISLDALDSNNDTTPTISGTTDLAAGESVTLSITDNAGNTQTVTATVDANGNFTVDVPAALAEGDYTVTATATDDAGNSASANATGTIDTTAPTLTLDPQGLGNDATPTISGSTDLAEGSVVSLVITDSAGNIQTVTATVDAAGNFTVDVPSALAEGSYSVEATATDEAGNSTSVLDNSGVIDITPPELNLDELTPENNLTPIISGTTNLPAGAIVTLTVVDSAGNTQTFAATVQTNGSFSANVPSPLAEGDYTVTATAQDAAGNQGSDSETGGSVDTTAPVITLEPLGTGNDNTPTISGNTDLAAGSTVTITVTDSVGTVQTFTATVDANGDFSADVPNPMADGNFDVTATATDAAGNTATDTVSGDINSAAPTLSLDPLGSGNDTTPTISGNTDLAPGSTVTLTVTDSAGNTQTFSAIVQGDGSFTADVPASLPEGDYSVTATATDGAGNSASVTENGGNIDTTAPSITIDTQGLGNDATPSISGTTDLNAGDTVSISVTDNAGNTQTFTAIVQNDGTYSADVPADLAEGSFSVTVTATDDAGNSATAIDNNGVIDTAAPTVTLDAQGLTNDATPTISGTTDLAAGNTVSINVTDSLGNTQTFTAIVQGNGSFSADVPVDLAEGDYTVEVTATDDAGNQNTAVDNNGTIDTTPPVINLDPVASGNDATPILSGTTDLPEGATITLVVTDAGGNVQNLTATVNADGTFSVEVPSALVDGDYDVTASASDAAGNSTTVSDSGNINASAPDITLDALGQTNDATPLISGTTNAPVGATVTLTVTDSVGAVQTFTTTVQGDGTFSASVPSDLAEGSYTVVAEVTDGAGNTGSDSETGGVVDTTSPAIDVADPGVGNDATPTISGTTDQPAGSTVSITITDNAGNIQTLTATVQGDGSFSVDVPATLAEGNYTVQATVVDEAGNTASDAETGVIDTISPVLTLDEPGTVSDSTPTINGTVDLPQGSTVQITVVDSAGNTQVFSALVGAGGVFSADVPAAMAEGNFTVSATATDEAGNSTTDNEAGVVDTLVPTLTIDVADTTNDATPLITGTTDEPAGSVVTILVTDSAGATQTLSAVVQVDGSFSISPGTDLAEGDFTVSATISDEAGNTATASDAGSIDTTAPTINLDAQGTGNDTTPAITGSTDLSPGSSVTITVTDSAGAEQTFTAIVDSVGNFSADVPNAMADGNFNVTATATDAAGNTASDTTSGNINTAVPNLTLDPLGTGNDTTPTISGTTDIAPGSTVSISVTDNAGNTQTFDAIVQANGTFSVDVPAALSEGSYSVTASATDGAGNTATANENGGVIDTTAPAAPTVDAGNGTEITGTAEAGAVVNVDVDGDGTPDFTVIADGDGNWSVTPTTPLADGVVVTATAVDEAGNVSAPTSDTVDAVAPVVAINDLTTNDATPELTGTVDDPSAIIIVTIDGVDYTATNNGDGSWTLADDAVAALADGSYTTTVTATDADGNVGSNSGTVVIDTTAPTVAINDLTTNDTTPELTGTVNDPNAVVVVTIDGNDYTATNNGDGTWTVADNVVATLAEGSYPISVSATDPAGNTVTNTGTVVIDTTAPTVAINDLTTNDTTPELTGTVNDPNAVVVVTIDGNDYTATNNGDGTWTLADNVVATLAEGSYPTSVSATDAAGNTVTNTGTVVIDTTAPTVAINDLTTNDTTPELTGTVNDPNAVVVVTIDGNDYTATNNGDGTWTLADNVVATLAEGSYPTSVTATDAAGNTATNTGTVVIDTTAPTVAINDLTTNDTTPELTGTVNDPNAVVVVTIDGKDYTATNNGDGTWTLADNVVATLAEGSYPTSVSATDAAGNTVTSTGTVVIDTTAPTVAINDLTTNDTTPELTGTVNDPNAVVVVTIDGNDYTATNNGDGTWTLADNIVALLAEGNYTATVTATDAVGNVATDTGAVVIDTSIDENNNGQTVTFDSISNDSGVAGDFITSDSTLVFNGTVDLGDNTTLTVTVDGTSYTFGTDPELTIDGSGNWSLDLTDTSLPAGTYTVVATVTDEAGNSASTTSQNVVVQALDAINDGNTVDMGEPVVTVNPPETTSDVQVIGLAESTGGVDASASFTVSPNNVGEVLIEVEQIALVAVADAYIVEVYDENGQLVYQGVSANSQLADVGGLEIFNVTGDETISFSLSGLDAGTYSVVVRNDENTLEDLLDSDGNGDVNLNELGTAGVVLGPDNQSSVLDTVETSLNGGILGILPGTVGTQVRGVLETLLDTTTSIGAGDLAGALTGPLGDLGLTGLLDDILTVIADTLLSNTLTLLQDTDITTTLTEYTYTGDLVAQGNLIDGDLSGVGADTILDGAQVTLVTNAAGDSVAVPATGTVTIQGNYGVLEIAADGTYTYTADGDRSAIGQDEVFNYTLSDGETSDIAALTITISGSDFPPVVAQTDNNDMELGAQTAIVNAPVSDSDFQVLGLAEGSPAAGSPEASTTLTVDAGFFGEVVVEVSQTALVAVADSYRIDIVDSDGNVVATAMTPDNPLIGDVAGVNLIGVTGDDTLVAKFSGLPAGDYTVVVRNDESALETLFDQNSDGSITLTELGDGGVVLGEENQEVVLTAVEDTLNGTNASILNGLGLGTVVRNLVLEPALSTADTIGAGDLVSTITTGLNLLGLGALVDTVLDAVAAALLSNTLTLLQSTDITSTLTEYAFEGSTTTSGNVIDAANTGDVTDSIAEGGVVTQVTHTNGESVTVLGTGLSGITIEGDYGDLTIFEDGSYTYVANGVRDGLGNTDSFSYTISDGRNTSTANLNFNLSGQGVSADSARAELTYDFVTDAGLDEPGALSHTYLASIFGGSFSDTSSTFAVATNTTQDITLNVDNGSLLSLVSSLTVTVEKFENGAWEAYRVFPNGELVSLLGIDGDTVLTVDGLTEGLYRLSMSGTTGVGIAGSISVDLSSTINYLDQFEVSGVQTATGNLFENDVLFGPIYDVTVSTDGTNFQDATGGTTLVGDYGTLQIDETGAYTYTPDNTQAVFGGTLTDTFTYRIEYPDGTVEQAEFNVFVTASGEGVPEVVTITSSEPVSASDSSGTVVTDEPTAPEVVYLTGQMIQTTAFSSTTWLVENESSSPLTSDSREQDNTAIETVMLGKLPEDTITLPQEDVISTTAPDESTPLLTSNSREQDNTGIETVTLGKLPEDTITLPQ